MQMKLYAKKMKSVLGFDIVNMSLLFLEESTLSSSLSFHIHFLPFSIVNCSFEYTQFHCLVYNPFNVFICR